MEAIHKERWLTLMMRSLVCVGVGMGGGELRRSKFPSRVSQEAGRKHKLQIRILNATATAVLISSSPSDVCVCVHK